MSGMVEMFVGFISLACLSASISLHRIARVLERLEDRDGLLQITLIADEEEKEETK